MRAPRSGPPRYLSTVLRWLFRGEIDATVGAEVCEELEQGYTIVRERHTGLVAWLWYLGQLFRPSTWVLARELRSAARVESAGAETLSRGTSSRLGISWLDVKLGLRMLVKYPGLSLVSVIGMSVAISIGVGGFGFIRAVLDGKLPLAEGHQVVALQNADVRRAGSRNGGALHDFVLWREELTSVVELSAFRTEEAVLQVPDGGPAVVPVAMMTASGFRVARARPILGRPLFDEDEREGATPAVVIGYDEWQRRFAGNPGIIGETLRLGVTEHTVVGVMPEGFRFPVNHGYWVPLRLDPTPYKVGEGPTITMFARLADGSTLEQAQAELTAISGRMAAAYPETHGYLRAQVLPYTHAFIGANSPVRMFMIRSIQFTLTLLLIAVAVNVAILVYARTTARMGEIAVRSALGASRRRVVTQLFAEALVLSTIAALIGLTFAALGFEWFQKLMNREDPGALPFWMDLGLSPAIAAYAAVMAVVAAVIIGILPGLKATGRAMFSGLQSLPGAGSRVQLGRKWTTLIVTQVAIAVAVLPYALYVLGPSISRGFAEPDYPVAEFLQASLGLDEAVVAAVADGDGAVAARFLDAATELLGHLEAEPQVAAVTFASHFPGAEQVTLVEAEGLGGVASVWLNEIDTNLFTVFDVPIMAGRGFRESDAGLGSNAVIVDRVFAEEFFGDRNVLGRRVRLPAVEGDDADLERREGPWLEIVGVVPDFTVPPAFQDKAPKLYRPLALAEVGGVLRLSIRLRGETEPATFMARLREITAAAAPNLRLRRLATASAAERERTVGLRIMALVIAAVMGSVLLLSAAGVYAMMSVIVASRRREIGIRAALGAAPGRLLASTFRRAGGQLAMGVLGGLALAEAVARTLGDSLLFVGERAYLLPAVALLLMLIGLLAAVGPALRGLRVQPTEALRGE